MTTSEVFIGIDVARDSLEVASRPAGEQWQAANNPAGIAILLERLRTLRPTLIVFEATGAWSCRCWPPSGAPDYRS
jgi:transposase